mmetsp:Transcript_24531/g.56860  ORF Transcript_24531/g.56860 Transcript_24531/m.56860 type:complete len:163 (+) Transcript_24531:47-535(+)|eukprot:CAMPEP_0172023050 /NCGR_PEP_ID=MMETSP1041-20130122/14589_1 /TAXON_ID=464988 /ORGANISM="Hemiselmis andersenii, Strain CCMP439" /LENGTH=162 /DNA_ID=CAMNT_0012678517 /DNA_START=9 /DNA_END=497 /DNA_ORIENTATION=+
MCKAADVLRCQRALPSQQGKGARLQSSLDFAGAEDLFVGARRRPAAHTTYECTLEKGGVFRDQELTLSDSSLSESSRTSSCTDGEEEQEEVHVCVHTEKFPRGILVKVVADGDGVYGRGKFQSSAVDGEEALWIQARSRGRVDEHSAKWRREVGKMLKDLDG